MVFWNQLEGNNVNVDGYDLAGEPKSPTYNAKMGFSDGKALRIFLSFFSFFLFYTPFRVLLKKNHVVRCPERYFLEPWNGNDDFDLSCRDTDIIPRIFWFSDISWIIETCLIRLCRALGTASWSFPVLVESASMSHLRFK